MEKIHSAAHALLEIRRIAGAPLTQTQKFDRIVELAGVGKSFADPEAQPDTEALVAEGLRMKAAGRGEVAEATAEPKPEEVTTRRRRGAGLDRQERGGQDRQE